VKREQPGQAGPHGRKFEQHVAERVALPGPAEEYRYDERRLMRYATPWALLLALPGIAVAIAHDVPVAAAVVAGVVLAVAWLVLRQTWRRSWSWPALVVLVLALVWPAEAWRSWLAPWIVGVAFYCLIAGVLWRMRVKSRKLVAQYGARYADWPTHHPSR